MSGPSFVDLVGAELFKLSRRRTAWLGLGLAAFIGLALPLMAFGWRMLMLNVFLADLPEDPHPGQLQAVAVKPEEVVWQALYVRNFFLPILLIVVGALQYAGELQARTLREDLMRPVARTSVLLAKWVAICAWILATVLATALCATLPAVILFGFSGQWLPVLLGYLLTLPAEAGFASLVLLVAVLTRSTVGTLAGLFLFWLFEKMLWIGLWFVTILPDFTQVALIKPVAEAAIPWLPSNAFAVWTGAAAQTDWSWQGFVVLAILLVGGLAAADRLFARADVP